MRAWLSSSILSWFPRDEGGTYLDVSMRQRSYKHLQRAEYFLTCDAVPSDHDGADCISNLRKCLSHRLKHFESVYNLRPALPTPKKRHYLDVLADLGVIRPSLIQGLFEVRNDVEYNDATPPDLGRCREFVDIVWYFLRSTDAMLYTQRTGMMLTPPDSDTWDSVYWCSFDLEYIPAFDVTLSGWIPSHLASTTEAPSHMVVEAETFQTKSEKWGLESDHADKQDDDVWITGRLLPRPDERHRIIRLALTAI